MLVSSLTQPCVPFLSFCSLQYYWRLLSFTASSTTVVQKARHHDSSSLQYCGCPAGCFSAFSHHEWHKYSMTFQSWTVSTQSCEEILHSADTVAAPIPEQIRYQNQPCAMWITVTTRVFVPNDHFWSSFSIPGVPGGPSFWNTLVGMCFTCVDVFFYASSLRAGAWLVVWLPVQSLWMFRLILKPLCRARTADVRSGVRQCNPAIQSCGPTPTHHNKLLHYQSTIAAYRTFDFWCLSFLPVW